MKLLYLHPSKPLKQYKSYDKLCFQIFKVQSTSDLDKYLSTLYEQYSTDRNEMEKQNEGIYKPFKMPINHKKI